MAAEPKCSDSQVRRRIPDRRAEAQRRLCTTTYAHVMAPEKEATERARAEALVVALSGLAAGDDPESTVDKLAELYRDDPFAGQELLRLAAEAIEESGASLSDPIDYAGIRERYLPERGFPWEVSAPQKPFRPDRRCHICAPASTRTSTAKRLIGAWRVLAVRLLRLGDLRAGGGRANGPVGRGGGAGGGCPTGRETLEGGPLESSGSYPPATKATTT